MRDALHGQAFAKMNGLTNFREQHTTVCIAIVVAAAALFLPTAGIAQRCTGTIETGCTQPGAVCSPVSSGVGPTGHCTTPAGLPKGERECDCVGATPLNLTGTWLGDDGGVYYLRQIGNQLWWAGFSTATPAGAGDLHKGLSFTNVFQGQITGNVATGEWADVPKGRILQNGTLTLSLSNGLIQRQAVTGGFGATQWNRIDPAPPPADIFTLFDQVKKNQNAWRDHSLLDNLKPAKSKPVAIFGTITQAPSDPDPMHVNYPTYYGRSYNDFICMRDNDSPPDGDIDFNIHVDRVSLDQEILFWSDGWETSHGITPTNFRNKLYRFNMLHIESVAYGGTTECGDDGTTSFLLPGWEPAGAIGVLLNGVPIGGQMDLTNRDESSARINSILGRPMQFGDRVRVSGNLALDCGHGLLHNCDEDVATTQNQEIHPTYRLDFVQNFQRERPLALLTGVWSSDDAGTYYLRQIGNAVWWLGLSVDEGRSFANVFRGTLQNGQVSGNWADVPLGGTSNAGTLTMTAGSGQLSTALTRTAVTGGFGGDSWEKLYDAGNKVIVVFDSATLNANVWPSTEPVELVVGNVKLEAQPGNPRAMKLPDGQQVMQADLNARIPITTPAVGPLRVAARFAGYRASWTIAETNLQPGTYSQSMAAPSILPSAVAHQPNKSDVTDRDLKPAGATSTPTAAVAAPGLTVHYHIEQAPQ